MTTKPRAKKFRIRRSEPIADGAQGISGTPAAEAAEARAQMKMVLPQKGAAPQTPQAQDPAQPTPQGADAEIDAIKREGLTGRQLRLARRVAQKNELPATSDYDAVRVLRKAGIDPFQRTNMLDMIPSNKAEKSAAVGRIQLPQTAPVGKAGLPSTETVSPSEMRAMEIGEIQKDIARRRRRRLLLLLARLSAFVFLPTIFAGWYFYAVATPMYSTKSEFLILQADATGGGSGIGGLLSGTQFATNQDSIATQSYLASKDAMLRLDRDEGFKSTFSQPEVDPVQRLDVDASNEKAYKLYKKYVKIGYDPTEGVIRMEIATPDPQTSARFAEALIGYAEQRVDDLSQRKREDQLKDARFSLEQAKAERREAQAAMVALQETTILDPEGVIASLRQQISNVQIQLQEKELQLAALEDNARPNQARVDGVRGDIRRLNSLLARLQSEMTEATQGETSLAQQTAQIQMAQADLATADLLMQSALQTLKQTELEANRQVRYLTTSVVPVASQDPSYPRKFENTILAFLIFSGIYLMISLTASILREQVSS
ncbi:capsule biosynthesis protein [Shimia sp. R10_1]|uniref:capsule biosynthesis protein n=1 Tax=Shimia sp. R10_1 TaxID=2821095 RepID=UPI001AD98055|nr:capsule biosynthesis protein [Shimia sp. R10_1]MBO9474658.1 capsule biosynthesis protein [Shimia sp. R10_1]